MLRCLSTFCFSLVLLLFVCFVLFCFFVVCLFVCFLVVFFWGGGGGGVSELPVESTVRFCPIDLDLGSKSQLHEAAD